VPSRDEKYTPALGAYAHGFSLHARVRGGAGKRKKLERLCRYLYQPPRDYQRPLSGTGYDRSGSIG